MFKLISILFIVIQLSQSIEFKCRFSGDYICIFISGEITNKNDRIVTQVSGDHLPQKSNNNVHTLDGRGTYLRYFPSNFTKFFPNIQHIFFERGMRELHKEDLQEFPNLRRLYLSYNNIEYLEKDLFIYNTKLVVVYFNDNNIKYVDPNVFAHLHGLTFLAFDDNRCHTGWIKNNRAQVVNLINEIKIKCSVDVDAKLKQLEAENARLKRDSSTLQRIRVCAKLDAACDIDES